MESESSIVWDSAGFYKHYLTLTPSQQKFADLVYDWILAPRKMFVMVSGGPGTGKTYTVTQTLKFVNKPQLRMAFTARSAHAIGGRTIHSTVHLNWYPGSVYNKLEKQLRNEVDIQKCIETSSRILGEFSCESDPFIIVVDEVAMINGWKMYWLIRYFMDRTENPLLFVVMGDRHQLNPVKSFHNIFSISHVFQQLYEIHSLNLVESKRFTPQYEEVIQRLRDYVDKEDEDGLFSFLLDKFPVVESIDVSMLKNSNKAMAFLNSTVEHYNNVYLEEMLPGKKILLYAIQNEKLVKNNVVKVKENCLIYVNQNGFSEAMNGTQLIFKKYDSVKDMILCIDPKTNKEVSVTRNEKGKFPIELGFTGTIHKFQGETIDDAKIVINLDNNRDLHLVYTALSRVRDMSQILAIQL